MSTTNRYTSFIQRLGYASPDVGGQLIFCVISFYLLKFYTDVLGISAAAAGTVFLIVRCIDAVDAPVWGAIYDRTTSRFGRHRPWFMWLCVPFAMTGLLMFLTPNLGQAGKVIYAGVTYALCSVIFTGINTPITTILSTLTPEPRERVALTCYRMFGSKAGVLIVNLSLLPLVALLGGGNDRRGFALTMACFAAVSVAFFLFAFSVLREQNAENHTRVPLRGSLGAFRGNWPWFIIVASNLLFWIAFIARIAMVPYFFEYVLHRKDLIPLANGLDFVSLGAIFMIPWFCRLTSKRNVWLVALAGSVAAQFVVFLGINAGSVPLVMAGWVASILTSGVAMALPFSLISDSVDYGEWKTGVRTAGLLVAVGTSFCLKAGSGLGGACAAWILDISGYVAHAVQTPRALSGILAAFIWFPMAAYAAAMIPVLFYGAFEKLEPRIHQELQARRAKSVKPDDRDAPDSSESEPISSVQNPTVGIIEPLI